jgi:hypothetical protein
LEHLQTVTSDLRFLRQSDTHIFFICNWVTELIKNFTKLKLSPKALSSRDIYNLQSLIQTKCDEEVFKSKGNELDSLMGCDLGNICATAER